MPTDAAAEKYGFTDAVFLKLDIQGAELEVLESAPKLLENSLLALRVEVEFLPIYQSQPLFSDIDQHLRGRGFLPVSLLQLRNWRRTTRYRVGRGTGPLQYSRGQLAHADAVYFRDPAALTDHTPQGVQAILKAAFLALTYECVDHAAFLLTFPGVRAYLETTYRLDVSAALGRVSRTLARRHRRRQWLRLGKEAGDLVGQTFCNLLGRPLHVTGPWPDR